MKYFKRIAALLVWLVFTANAWAGIFVDRSIVTFEQGAASRQDVRVTNDDAENPAYIQVEVLSVESPGTDAEQQVRMTDPEHMTLLATPEKMIIPPGGQKLVRIVNLEPGTEAERIYRVNVTPILPPLQDEAEGNLVRVVVAYQLLVIVPPALPEASWTAKREGKKLTFTNTGNTNLLLHTGRQCAAPGSEDCRELVTHRLYAGNTWTQDLPFDQPAEYLVQSLEGEKKEIVR